MVEQVKSDVRDRMATAAQEAAKELRVDGTAKEFVTWVYKWYLVAGYKNLMRIAFQAFGLGG